MIFREKARCGLSGRGTAQQGYRGMARTTIHLVPGSLNSLPTNQLLSASSDH